MATSAGYGSNKHGRTNIFCSHMQEFDIKDILKKPQNEHSLLEVLMCIKQWFSTLVVWNPEPYKQSHPKH